MRTPWGPRRSVVVTGAGAGVGRATALAFAARGDRVALLARGSAGLAAAADEVRQAGGEALVVRVDLADARAVEDAAQQVADAFGSIDVWVNDAFAGVFAPFTCCPATAARSSRSAPRSPTAECRCSRRTAAPSTRSSPP